MVNIEFELELDDPLDKLRMAGIAFVRVELVGCSFDCFSAHFQSLVQRLVDRLDMVKLAVVVGGRDREKVAD